MIEMMLKYELKKVFSKRINQIALTAALVLAVAFSLFAVKSVRYTDEDGGTHTGIMAARKLAADRNRWKGELTAEKIAEAVKSNRELKQKYSDEIPDEEYGKTKQSYNEITDFAVSILAPDSDWDENVLYQLSDEQADGLYSTYKENIQKMVKEYGETKEQQKFLKEQYEKIKMPFSYKAMVSWDTMILYAETYGIILAIVIGFLAAGIFAEEFSNRAEAVFYAAKHGRSKAVGNKIKAGMLMTTIVYWSGVLILSFISFAVMGVSGFMTPYQMEQPYSIYPMTYGQYYLMILICGYIACLLSAAVCMLVAAKMRTANVAVCIPFFLFCVMPFIGRAFSSFIAFFKLTPDMLMNIMQCVKNPNIFQIGSMVFRQIPFIMLLYFAVSIVLLPFVYKSFCRYGLNQRRLKGEKR